jgi:hypothetical protein
VTSQHQFQVIVAQFTKVGSEELKRNGHLSDITQSSTPAAGITSVGESALDRRLAGRSATDPRLTRPQRLSDLMADAR